ncbi:uncharacterized protein EI90DRAFT_3046636 [Cantharellus anzutake]|uniref:uncharacterized protein n=1 Tax=Cantharellus anzutake TaxID=1750568 RepID=UPI00190610C7|nr:uncharacterized protein EI90DRAFT_3090477 [Cantharellus anzutake]XP_038919460.1 uncharacterized protein EI90DRAFT_3046636 [Cantharellus anzutake]KAF8314360.1 hypothetical protein EI90DRAFT_3090477 [Cantharellus anzutake]KAF8336647.1 hypothetical protein EI90DRAFT_3046636 [Cantharellus anzutake]
MRPFRSSGPPCIVCSTIQGFWNTSGFHTHFMESQGTARNVMATRVMQMMINSTFNK